MTADQQPENSVLKQNRWMFWMCFISLITTAFFFAVRAQIIGAIGVEFHLSETEKGWLMGVKHRSKKMKHSPLLRFSTFGTEGSKRIWERLVDPGRPFQAIRLKGSVARHEK